MTTYKTKLPLPEPGIGEVRLRVQAIGLNRVLGSSVTPGCLHFVSDSGVFANRSRLSNLELDFQRSLEIGT